MNAIDMRAHAWLEDSDDDAYRERLEAAARRVSPLRDDARALLKVRDRFNAFFEHTQTQEQLAELVQGIIDSEARVFGALEAVAEDEATHEEALQEIRACSIAYEKKIAIGMPVRSGERAS